MEPYLLFTAQIKMKIYHLNHHYSLRTKDWRYIIYDSGKEELYHNAVDPKEWNNLIYEKTHPKRDEMVKILKKITYPMVPNGLKKLQL